MIGRLREERGIALVMSMMVLLVLLMVGLAAMSLADGQTGSGAFERRTESTFNLTDAVMKNQIQLLSLAWPGSATAAYPSSCTQSSSNADCPNASNIQSQFTTPDYSAGIAWTTQVQDNAGPIATYYSTAGATACGASCPSYDANGDGKVWLRAQATVRGQTRVVVTEVTANASPQPFPQNVVTAGYFATNNQGRKVIVDTKGNAAQPAPLEVRCTTKAPSSCLNYDPTKGQVSPDTTQTGYTGGFSSPCPGLPTPCTLTTDQLSALRTIAIANGTHYTTCPSSIASPVVNGQTVPVFVENGPCSFTSGSANTAALPGMLVIASPACSSAALALGGNFTYHGLVYVPNTNGCTGNLVTLTGTSEIDGAVAVDGNAGVVCGASKANIVFNSNAFNSVLGFSGASAVQSTWRELPAHG
jgi:Tfp pilus assembly protein PilX